MTPRILTACFALLLIVAVLVATGCDKERIVESTEYVHETEYVELPPDTIVRIDTVFHSDSVVINESDTVFVVDTIMQVTQVHDTIRVTTTVYDTVVTVQHHYDTTRIVDTVAVAQYAPNASLAVAAMHYHCDPLVYEFISQEFGLTDGWVYYLSTFQMDITQPSTNVYDVYGFVDYWTTDWSGYYPLEILWRMTYKGGDPSNPNNWEMGDPPAASSVHQPGIQQSAPRAPIQTIAR